MSEPNSPNDIVFYGERSWHFPHGLSIDDVPYNDPDLVSVGELIPSNRLLAFGSNGVCGPVASGTMMLRYFTAKKDERTSSLETYCGSTAAGATPTLCKVGVFEIASNGDGIRIAISDNNTGLWAAANTAYNQAFLSSFWKKAGNRYALAILAVSAAAMPNYYSSIFAGTSIVNANFIASPRIAGVIAGQADIPENFIAANVTSGRQAFTGLLQ